MVKQSSSRIPWT